MEIIQSKTASLSMAGPNVLLVTMKEDAVVDIPESIENYDFAMRLTAGKKYLVLVDARKHATVTPEARAYASRPEMYENVIAQAIVTSSLANRLLANFLIKLHKQNSKVEMKLFNDYDAAMSWLNEKLVKEKIAD